MGYKVKWVEDHLGISRKALRNYERLGLMRTRPITHHPTQTTPNRVK